MPKHAWEPNNRESFIETYYSGASNDELAKLYGSTSDKVDHYLRSLRAENSILARGAFVPTEKTPDSANGNKAADLKLLRLLKSNPGALSVVDLANELDLSPRKIEDMVERLSAENFLVEMENGFVKSSEPKIGGKSSLYMDYEKGNRFSFGVVADTHLCSKYERLDVLNTLYDIFEAQGVSTVYHCGNWIDGEARFNKQDLKVHGLGNQVNYLVTNYPARDGITTYMIGGDDHEGWYQQREGINIGVHMQDVAKRNGREDLVYLGYMEHDVIVETEFGKTSIRVQHPGGGSAYAVSYTPQKIVESLSGGDKPNILLLGHYHKAGYFFMRNIHCLLAGCTETQTPFMRKKRLAAHIGGWLCEVVQGDDGSVLEFTPRYFPFYDTSSSDDSWSYME